jgi:hypothetical protein
MKVNILTQVLRKKKYESPFKERTGTEDMEFHRTELYNKDVVGFIIFIVVIFVFFMISSYGRT